MGYTYQKYPTEFRTSLNGRPDKLYMVWYDMHKRCKAGSRDAKRYHLRGIRVCEEWAYWPTFAVWARANGWRAGLEIDRRDGNLGYTPGNCRIVDQMTQNANRDYPAFLVSCKLAQRKVHQRPFICVETGEIFQTQAEAREVTGIFAVGDALRGRIKTAGGRHWKYLNQIEPSNQEALVNPQVEYAHG